MFLFKGLITRCLCAAFLILFVRMELNAQYLSDFNGDLAKRLETLNQSASELNKDSTNKALAQAHEAYLLSLKNDLPYWQAVSLLNLSEGYLYNDSYDQALQYAFNALDLYTSLKFDSGIARCYTMLGWIFYDTENPGFSLDYHRKALMLNADMKNQKDLALSYNAVGLVFQMKNDNDSAIIYFKNALAIARKEELPLIERAALNNLGICENASGNYSLATRMFTEAMNILHDSTDELFTAEVCNQMAFSYLKLKDFNKSDSLLKLARTMIDLSSSNSRKEKQLDNLWITSQLNQATGDFSSAFENLLEYTRINNEVISRNKTEVVMAQQLKREAHKREAEINEIIAQKELRVFQRNAMGIGALLLIIIGVLAFSRFNQKRKREKQEETIKQLLIKSELKKERQAKEELDNRLQHSKLHIKDYAHFVKYNDELINEFIEGLTELHKDAGLNEKTQVQLNKTIKSFLSKYEQVKDDQAIKMDVDKTNTEFFQNLLNKYPHLTKNEQRLCAQVRMDLSSKDIAAANNISVKSVEMARYRLRKQLGLKTEEELGKFLKQF